MNLMHIVVAVAFFALGVWAHNYLIVLWSLS